MRFLVEMIRLLGYYSTTVVLLRDKAVIFYWLILTSCNTKSAIVRIIESFRDLGRNPSRIDAAIAFCYSQGEWFETIGAYSQVVDRSGGEQDI